jgi:hypothetical protein
MENLKITNITGNVINFNANNANKENTESFKDMKFSNGVVLNGVDVKIVTNNNKLTNNETILE